MSIYREENTITIKTKYERLHGHPKGEIWRVIFDDDDYDYIKDPKLFAELEMLWIEKQINSFKWDGHGIPSEVEDSIADQAGLLREWNHLTKEYTETQLEWLKRVHAYWKSC